MRIAVINPVFTAAAYSSFYHFYDRYRNVPKSVYIKQDLNLLNSTVDRNSWGHSYGLYSFIESETAKQAGIILGQNTFVLSDIGVNNGSLSYSSNGTRRFDVVILGFTEYVTAREYSNYKHFVETGGKLIILSACNFLAEVSYNALTNRLALVKGHGWEFNSTAAWKGPFHRWSAENTNWVGSEFALFHKDGYSIDGATAITSQPLSVLMRNTFGQHVFLSYLPHEENVITNSSDKVIAYWKVSNLPHHNWTVAAYEHDYRGGVVIHTGVFGTDMIATNREMQFFLLASIGPLTPQATVLRDHGIYTDYVMPYWQPTSFIRSHVVAA